MDYSEFYEAWLNFKVAPGEAPDYYAIFGISPGEFDDARIRAAIEQRLTAFEQVDFSGNVSAFRHILEELILGKCTLTNPTLRRKYDAQRNDVVYMDPELFEFEKPGLIVRIRQWALMTVAFGLGMCIALYMGATVERNPDHTINFSAKRAIVQKIPMFTRAPGKAFPRPSLSAGGLKPRKAPASTDTDVEKRTGTDSSMDVTNEIAEAESSNVSTEESASTALDLEEPSASTEVATTVETESETGLETESETGLETESETGLETESETEPETTAQERVTPTLRQGGRRRSPLYERHSLVSETNKSEPTELVAEETPTTPEPDAALTVLASGKVVPPTQEQWMKAIPDTVKTRIAAVTDVENRQKLALALCHEAQSSPTKDAACYATYRLALELSIAARNITLVSEIFQAMDKDFEIPLFEEKRAAVKELTSAIATAAPTMKDKSPIVALVRFAIPFVQELTQAQCYEEAAQWSEQLHQICSEAYVDPAIKQITLKLKQRTTQTISLHNSYQKSLEILKTEPANSEANMKVALWICQMENDFVRALPYFAKSGDNPLSRLAETELNATGNNNTLELADGWWNIAHRIGAPMQQIIYKHATSLYKQLDLASLDSGTQIRVAERTEERQK